MLANDTDPEGDPLIVEFTTGPSHGLLGLTSDGSFEYQPNEDFVGQDTFTYTADDGTEESNPATVTITVGAGCDGRQATIPGTAGRDTLTGTAGPDVYRRPRHAPDVIRSAGGDDAICSGGGNDFIRGGGGNDLLVGGSRNDRLEGNARIDALHGGAGADLLAGGAASPDTCDGGTDTDALLPNHGCEQITGVP